MVLEPPTKKVYRPPQIRSEKILVSNLFATICTVCSPACPQAC